MLHAFNQKNVRRVLAQRDDEHVNDKNEDGVTSMAFSPLAFMPTDEAMRVLEAVIGAPLRDALRGREVLAHDVTFWPSGLRACGWSSDANSRCEPDLLVLLTISGGGELVLVGEMKWDWRIADGHLADEIRRERRAVSLKYPKADLLAFAITKFHLFKDPPDTVPLTWVGVQRSASLLHFRSPGSIAGRWGGLVSVFLAKAKQTSFQGFHVPNASKIPRSTPVFWNAPDV